MSTTSSISCPRALLQAQVSLLTVLFAPLDVYHQERVLKCRKVVVAVGGRPKPLICEGGDLAMTSDDLFSASPPGKTLVVGASYVALECAGATCLL